MKIIFAKWFSLFSIFILIVISLVSCASDNILILANYESYMSENLKTRLRNQVNELRFDYFTSNENMITNFKNGTYTISNASTYAIIELINQNELQKIEWNQFQLTNPETNTPIQNANDALSLFIKPVQAILQSFKNQNNEPINLLEYCIPYFLQNYIFTYRGKTIPELEKPVTWAEILDFVGKNPTYFKNSQFGAVEDERTLFSVANLINSNNTNVNPISGQANLEIEDYVKIFQNLSENRINATTLGRNPSPIFLNSDSSIILNKIATNSLHGAMLFNGDAIFAAQGGEDGLKDLPTSDNFHFVIPQNAPLALDCLILNKKKIVNNSFKQKVYDILKTTALEGSDSNDPISFSEQISEDVYKNGPMENFSFVQYTSPLKIISDPENSVVFSNDYFENTDDPQLTEAIKKAYKIDIPNNLEIGNLVENPLNSWEKQTLVNAYIRFKERYWS